VSLVQGGYVVAGKAVYDAAGSRVASVVVSGGVDTALAVLDAVRGRLWITFWVALVVAGALGFAFSEFIGRRVRAMSQAAAAIAAGDFSQRLPTGFVPDEIRDLAVSYNRMAIKLGEAFSAIQQREGEIAAVVESMAEGVIAFDAAGTVRVMNSEAKTLLGDPQSDLTGTSATQLTDDESVLRAIEAGLAGDAVVDVAELGHASVLIHCTPLRTAERDSAGAVLLLSDITEQRRLEDAQRRFVANASHEMRTPIAALKGLLELLEDGAKDDPPVRDDFITTMQLEVDRLGRLVADLLTLAQLEAGTFELELHPESAKSLLGRVCSVMRALTDKAGVDLDVELPDGDVTLMADRDRIVQVLIGFADNALKHSKRGQRIVMRARVGIDTVTLEVADQGPGIAEQDVERIFDRFYRADESRSSRGAGLGLSIAKEIAEAHGTAILVSATPGGGQTFSLTLPLAE
jgi:PAS domain S-box-containing protein